MVITVKNNTYNLVITDPQMDGNVQFARGDVLHIEGVINCCPEQLMPTYTVTSGAVPVSYQLPQPAFYELPATYQQAGFTHTGNVAVRCFGGEPFAISMLNHSGDIKHNAPATITFCGAIAL